MLVVYRHEAASLKCEMKIKDLGIMSVENSFQGSFAKSGK